MMALWHTLVRNVQGLWIPDGEAWDDGQKVRPGDTGFKTQQIEQRANGRMFNYVGTPDWQGV